MNKLLLILILSFAIPLYISGQIYNNCIIKTKLFQDMFAQNPNIEIEKIFSKNISLEYEIMWRRRDWASSGGEWNIGKYYNSQGFTTGFSFKYYFSSKPAPNAWYGATLFRYNYTVINGLDKVDFYGDYLRTVDLNRYGFEMGFLIGKQFIIKKVISTEIYLGVGDYEQTYDENLIAGDAGRLIEKRRYSIKKPYLGWTIGYYIRNKKE